MRDTVAGEEAGQLLADNQLWHLAREAVADAGARADEYLATGSWIPKIDMPKIDAFDSGWPDLSRPLLSSSSNGRVNYVSLFGRERRSLTPLAYDDAPALVRFIDYVRGRPDLRARLFPEHMTDPSFADSIFVTGVANLPLSLLDRTRAVGATDSDLVQLYAQRERAWLSDRLPVEYVIPLALTPLDLDEPLVLDASTRIEPLDTGTQAARAPDRVNSVNSVPTPVVSAATHAIVLSGHYLDNPGPIVRIFTRAPENIPLADADLVCEALRILTHVDVGYAQVLLRPIGWADRWEHDLPAITRIATLRRYPDGFDNYAWLRMGPKVTRDELDLLPKVVASLRNASAKIRLAVKRLSIASLRSDDDDRTVDACIGLEALLSDSRDELTHRLALRAATALSTRADNPADAKRTYGLMRAIYKHRSAVVHGDLPDKHRIVDYGNGRIASADLACILLRELLMDVLQRPGGWTPAKLDELLFSRLNMNEGYPSPSQASEGGDVERS
ncbi:hypothetical protein [Nonomuraea wenchangensis]|uniref:hypothetical protein n=1 Tax=Nonomuraea wenchangensis TaxID=568860 RepID=UPI00331E94BB